MEGEIRSLKGAVSDLNFGDVLSQETGSISRYMDQIRPLLGAIKKEIGREPFPDAAKNEEQILKIMEEEFRKLTPVINGSLKTAQPVTYPQAASPAEKTGYREQGTGDRVQVSSPMARSPERQRLIDDINAKLATNVSIH